jgi:hypothetical protein
MEIVDSQMTQASCSSVVRTSLHSSLLEQDMFAKLATLSSNISRLAPRDADLFRTTFQKEEICYANSWLYLLRSTRNDQGQWGYKFVGNETLMGMSYRHNTVYLVHPMGADRFRTTLDLCYEIRSKMQCPIVLKKIDQELYEYLYSTQLFQKSTNDATLFEEEAFPEHILPLEKLYNSDFGLYQQSIPFMRKVKRFEKSSTKLLTEAEISDIEGNPGFQNLFGFNPEKYQSYMQIIREARLQTSEDSKYKACVYYDEHETVHGLYISELLEKESMGLYCAVSSRAYPGITEWMDHDFFQQVFYDNIHYLYLGGSETKGVDAYVKKLLPSTPQYLMQPLSFNHQEEELYF